MARRANQSPEARDRERVANRERMRRARENPAQRDAINARRREQDRARKGTDEALVSRLRANGKRHYERRKGDASFWAPRKEYMVRWKAERREAEEFEAFMARMEMEEGTHDTTDL